MIGASGLSARVALIGAMAAALALAGCGRKSVRLDPPPSAIAGQAQPAPPETGPGLGEVDESGFESEPRPAPPPTAARQATPAKKTFILDFLLN